MKKRCTSISIKATAEETVMLETLKRKLKRRSNTDTIRFLIVDTYEKFLPENNPSGIKQEA